MHAHAHAHTHATSYVRSLAAAVARTHVMMSASSLPSQRGAGSWNLPSFAWSSDSTVCVAVEGERLCV